MPGNRRSPKRGHKWSPQKGGKRKHGAWEGRTNATPGGFLEDHPEAEFESKNYDPIYNSRAIAALNREVREARVQAQNREDVLRRRVEGNVNYLQEMGDEDEPIIRRREPLEEKKGGYYRHELNDLIDAMDVDEELIDIGYRGERNPHQNILTALDKRLLVKDVQCWTKFDSDVVCKSDWLFVPPYQGICLSNLAQGAASGQRIGNQIQMQALEFRFQLRFNGLAVFNPPSSVRLIIVLDKMEHDPNGENIMSRLFGSMAVSSSDQYVAYINNLSILTPYQENYKEQFIILRDKTFDMQSHTAREVPLSDSVINTATIVPANLPFNSTTTGSQTMHQRIEDTEKVYSEYWHIPLKNTIAGYADGTNDYSALRQNNIYYVVMSTTPSGNAAPRLAYFSQLKYIDP